MPSLAQITEMYNLPIWHLHEVSMLPGEALMISVSDLFRESSMPDDVHELLVEAGCIPLFHSQRLVVQEDGTSGYCLSLVEGVVRNIPTRFYLFTDISVEAELELTVQHGCTLDQLDDFEFWVEQQTLPNGDEFDYGFGLTIKAMAEHYESKYSPKL